MNRRLFAVAAVCAGYYLAAQTFQWVVNLAIPAADRVRAVAILLSMFAIVPVYVVVALDRFRHHPGAAVCGAIFGVLFVAFEIGYRSLELVFPLPEPAIRGVYLALLGSHLLSSFCFVLAFRGEKARWDHLAQIAFGLNALRLIGRLLGGYAGVDWLTSLSGTLYFPFVAVIMTLLTVWLARRAAL